MTLTNSPFPLLLPTHGGQLEAAGITVGDGWDILSTICARFPLRSIGSSGETENARHLAGLLEQAGLQEIRIEPVACLGFDVGPCELKLDGPGGKALDALPVAFSGSTPPEGLTAPLVYADDVEFVNFADSALRGKILLLFGWFGDFSTTNYYRAGVAAGLAGVIVIRDSDHTVSYGLPPAAAGCGNVPIVSVSHATGTAILRSGAGHVFLRVSHAIRETVGSNVVGLLPANRTRIDDRVFLVSAHLDAPPVCPAAADNAAGAAMAVEVLRTLARTDRGRDIWFAGYTDEEYGFSGSRQFAADHADIVRACQCQFYYDGHGTAAGVNHLVVTGPAPLADFLKAVAADIGHPMKVEMRANTLDPVVLFADGVPAVQVGRHPQRTWHTQHDAMDDLAPQALRAGIHLYAEALYRLVHAPEIPFPRAVDEGARTASRRQRNVWTPKTLEEATHWQDHL